MARRLGPGLLLAVAGIGSSHFLLAPTAGARFGTALAWTIVVAHLVKYPAFRDATLYTVRTGRNVLDGFGTFAGGRATAGGVLALFAAQTAFVLAGVSLVTVGVVLAVFPSWFPATVFVGVVGACGILQWTGGYRGLERFSTWALGVLAFLTIVAVIVGRPGAEVLGDMVTPALPEASGVLMGALLGFMPAPLELAVIKSLWTQQHMGPKGDARAQKDALFDYRLGYGVSIALATMLMALGAHFLHADHPDAGGFDVLALTADGYAATLGRLSEPVILGAAFLGMFSTTYAVVDGFPRTMAAALHTARGTEMKAVRDHPMWWFLYASGLGALAVVLAVPDPVAVVGWAANVTVILAPFWAGMLLWLMVKDEDARGPRHEVWTSAVAVVALVAVAVFVAVNW